MWVTVHYVYVHGDSGNIDTTMGIAREVVPFLRARHDVALHHPNDPVTIDPRPGDILIGHPNRHGDCVFRRSFARPGWSRRIVFAPMSHAVLTDAALIDDLVAEADIYLGISGAVWMAGMADTLLSHWQHKFIRCGLGVRREHFPPIKSHFNPAGARRILYIGSADILKGGDYLADLADANPDIHFGWVRTGDSRHCLGHQENPETPAIRRRMRASRLHEHPVIDWRRPDGLKLLSTYDFIIAPSRSEALPCEILEAAAYGLVPLTTWQSGYAEDDWITNFPWGDVAGASATIRQMLDAPEAELQARQTAGRRQLDATYTWRHLADAVELALTIPLPAEPRDTRWQARKAANRKALHRIARQAERADVWFARRQVLLQIARELRHHPWHAARRLRRGLQRRAGLATAS